MPQADVRQGIPKGGGACPAHTKSILAFGVGKPSGPAGGGGAHLTPPGFFHEDPFDVSQNPL